MTSTRSRRSCHRCPSCWVQSCLQLDLSQRPSFGRVLVVTLSVQEVVGADTGGVYAKLHDFITESMAGWEVTPTPPHCDKLYQFNGFELHASEVSEQARWEGCMKGESNIGQWTMRLCDYMVDQVCEWDLIVCNSDNLSSSFQHGSGDSKYYNNIVAREMQMVFRHRAGGRRVFMATTEVKELGRPPLEPPPYWTEKGCIDGSVGQKLVPGSSEELAWMQEILDKTFKNKVTRDRKDDQLADRYKAVQCIRSEHPGLWDRFAQRRRFVAETCQNSPNAADFFVTPKTLNACQGLDQRCTDHSLGNPSNQAYLLHGTNPTSAVAILSSSFTVNLAGKSAGVGFRSCSLVLIFATPEAPRLLPLQARCLGPGSTWRKVRRRPMNTPVTTWVASTTASMPCWCAGPSSDGPMWWKMQETSARRS